MKVIGIVPARAGSTAVKNKNIRLLNNQPLLSYAINTGLNSSLDRVILSTDSPEYQEIGKKYNAETPFLRPKKFSTTTASSFDVIIHCLDFLKAEENYQPDAVFLLRPTSPFRTANQIDEAIQLLESENVDSVSAMTTVNQHPYFMFQYDSNGKLFEYDQTENKPERRQDLPRLWEANCHTMLSTADYLYRENQQGGRSVVNFKNFIPYFIDGESALDIDTEEDFKYAEFLMSQENKNYYD